MKYMYYLYLFLFLGITVRCSPLPSSPSSDAPNVPANVPRAASLEIKTTLNSPEVDISSDYPVSKKEFFGDRQEEYLHLLKNQTIFPAPQVFGTVLIENKSRNSLNIKVVFDGSLQDEVEESFQGWQEDQWVTAPISSTIWRHAPVIMEVKQWKTGNVLSEPTLAKELENQQGKIFEVMQHSGLLIILLTRYDFKDVLLGNRPEPGSSNARVDLLSLLGDLRISSAAKRMPTFWNEEFSSSQTPISLRISSF